MYKFYELAISNGVDIHKLTYKLEEHRPAQVWAKLIDKTNVQNLKTDFNPWRGMAIDLSLKTTELNELIDSLNCWLPDPIKDYWNDKDPQDSLNKLHVHFPEIEKNLEDEFKKNQLSRYNDIIHEIEHAFRTNQSKKEMPIIIISEKLPQRRKMIKEDYKHFSVKRNFGDLKLLYCHIGKHPWEIFVSRDLSCPIEQIVPQHEITTDHFLTFFDSKLNLDHFEQFYYKSRIKWPYKLDDPKLAIGDINLGKLLNVDNKEYDQNEILSFIKKCNKVVGWKVY